MGINCSDLTTDWNLNFDQFYDRKVNFKFDVCNPKYFEISENGTLATAKAGGIIYSIISTNTAFDKGVHKWSIKVVDSMCGSYQASIGVITDIENAMKAGTDCTRNGFKCFRWA